jgi:hypothetical protein
MDKNSTSISVNLSIEQLIDAVRRLPDQEKITVWRILDQEIDRDAIALRFTEAVQAIRAGNPNVNEDEVMADVLQAIQEVRASRRNAQDRP